MPDKAKLRKVVKDNLNSVMGSLNSALNGQDLATLEPVITRLGRGGVIPHWYPGLKASPHVLPNLDGKTIGSVLEMIFVAILETGILKMSAPMQK